MSRKTVLEANVKVAKVTLEKIVRHRLLAMGIDERAGDFGYETDT